MSELTITQVGAFLEVGIRPVPVPREQIKGDMIGGFLMVPTSKGEWIRKHAKKIKSSWEGSYKVLIIYSNNTAVILVDHKEVDKWQELTSKISVILHMPVSTRGD